MKLRPVYADAKRGIGQVRSAGEAPDVTGTPFWIECKHKHRTNIEEAVRQARAATDGRPVLVVSRRTNDPILVTMDFETFRSLVGVSEAVKALPEVQRFVEAFVTEAEARARAAVDVK